MDKSKLTFRKGDLLAIVFVLVLASAVALFFAPGRGTAENAMVQIFRDGKLMQELSLESDQSILITGEYENTVVIRDGRACIAQSTCPGEDCVHSGGISSPGRSVVCLPNRVEIRITGSSDVDFVVG